MLRPHPDPSPIAGWHIVDLARHAESWEALTVEESSALGPLLARATRAIREVTGCTRVYVLSFCEAVPHLHLHLAPRHSSNPRGASWSIADLYRDVQGGRAAPADPALCASANLEILVRLQRG